MCARMLDGLRRLAQFENLAALSGGRHGFAVTPDSHGTPAVMPHDFDQATLLF